MTYQDSWYLEKRIVWQRLSGTVTLEDAEMSRDSLIRLLEEGTPLVHVIVDVSEVQKFPTNLAALTRMASHMRSPNLGWLIIYGANNIFIRFLASTISQVGLPGVRLRLLDNMDQSLTFLQSQDSTLGNLQSFSDSA